MYKRSVKSLLKSLAIPVIMLAVLLFFFYFGKYLPTPSPQELVNNVIIKFGTLELWAIFLIAIVEGFLLLGQYFPGGIVVFFSIVSAGKDLLRISILTFVISISFIIAYILNYLIGKYGLYHVFARLGFKKSLEKSKKKVHEKAAAAIALSYADPNLASITATAAGIIRLPFKRFLLLSIVWVFLWNIFWAIIIYILGGAALDLVGMKYIFFVLALWIIIILFHFFFPKNKNHKL